MSHVSKSLQESGWRRERNPDHALATPKQTCECQSGRAEKWLKHDSEQSVPLCQTLTNAPKMVPERTVECFRSEIPMPREMAMGMCSETEDGNAYPIAE
jgi:hypothetical protein